MRILILLVAGGAALFAAMLVRNMAKAPEPQIVQVVEEKAPEPQVPLQKVLVAADDLPLGHRIAPEDLTWTDWPEGLVTETYFTEENAPQATTELAGSVVRMPMFSGEPVLDQKIVRPGEAGIMAAVIHEGMRAVAVEISVETAAGGFILPNDRVDVILSYSIEAREGDLVVERPSTKTVLKNVRVLAIDQTYREVEGEDVVVGTTATLELRPEHAETLMLATRMGDISLALRGVADAGPDNSEVIASADIRSAQEENSGTIRIYRSGVVEQASVGGSQ